MLRRRPMRRPRLHERPLPVTPWPRRLHAHRSWDRAEGRPAQARTIGRMHDEDYPLTTSSPTTGLDSSPCCLARLASICCVSLAALVLGACSPSPVTCECVFRDSPHGDVTAGGEAPPSGEREVSGDPQTPPEGRLSVARLIAHMVAPAVMFQLPPDEMRVILQDAAAAVDGVHYIAIYSTDASLFAVWGEDRLPSQSMEPVREAELHGREARAPIPEVDESGSRIGTLVVGFES